MIFSAGDIRAAWQGLKSMAAINDNADKSKQHIGITDVTDTDLSNTFNAFFSRFERSDFTNSVTRVKDSLVPQCDFQICQDQVTALLKKTNVRKAAGPDSICGRTLRYCADQLSGVFCTLFQMCANQCQLPACWKTSTIIPVPENPKAQKN